MSSIRPLVTITILVVVGVLLYVKINEGTPRTAPGAADAWNQPADGVPPLATTSVAPTTSDGAATPWPMPAAAPPMDAANAPPATPNAAELVPAIPEMPEIAATTQANLPAAPAVPFPNALPANIPEARYPDQAPAADAGVQGNASLFAQETATTPEQMNEATAAAAGISATPQPLRDNPLRPSTQTTPADRYGASAAAITPVAPATPSVPVAQSFVQSWPAIQASLNRGELTEAHKLLSRWHGDPSLTPTDAERVDSLLSQLAGTVVYSTEHRLAPAHVVKPGETLETIAKEYNVPWQLLAKINRVPSPDKLQPGQELKVLRGPFSATVDLSRNELTLMVDDRYAGKFPVTMPPGQSIADGEWVVGNKSNELSPGRALLLQGNASTPGTLAPMLIIASESLPTTAADGTVIKVAAKDAEELSDILSIGSRVVTRR